MHDRSSSDEFFFAMDSHSSLDTFLSQLDDPSAWRRLPSDSKPLSREELDILFRIQNGLTGDLDYDPFAPSVDFFTKNIEVQPISLAPAPKRRFLPSLNEAKIVRRLVHAIRMGWIRPKEVVLPGKRRRLYDLWKEESMESSRMVGIPPPKVALPGHRESYRPPPEYLPSAVALRRSSHNRKWTPTRQRITLNSSTQYMHGYTCTCMLFLAYRRYIFACAVSLLYAFTLVCQRIILWGQ